MKVICNYNDPLSLPEGIPDDFDYGLEIGKEYIVMGIITYKGSNCLYYLVDTNGRPGWFPFMIFSLKENILPSNWFLKVNGDKENSDIFSLIGFEELCNDILYYDNLTNREEEAMRIYFKRKIELGEELSYD